MIDYIIECCATDFVIVFRMLFAAFVGCVIGYERQRMGKSAGMRTHIIVCMSTAMIVAVSIVHFPVPDSGARTIAAIITGIGFLGAGQIMNSGGRVSGITTAASIWTNAMIGSIVGLGYYLVAFFASVVLVFTFRLKKFEGTPWRR
ncbi:MAG: MgtC/SapB family protein [archaeon]